MKKLLLLSIAIGISISSFAQNRVTIPQNWKNKAVLVEQTTAETFNFKQSTNQTTSTKATSLDEAHIGNTRYDLQTNSTTQNRIYFYEDGTIGAAWTQGFSDPNFADRGTGYNYFDGSTWGDLPTERIEPVRNGWPSYANWGTNGEITCSHTGGNDGLILSRRDTKGTGDWAYSYLQGPDGNLDLLWPRMVTGGENNDVIHVIAITPPTANGGTVHENLNGALLYSRSNDGGETWAIQNQILPGTDSESNVGFSGDTYSWAEPKGDNIAFIVGNSWTDFFMMKSADGGDTWEKTIIWTNPYPMWEEGTVTDTFYDVDGSFHIALDNTNKAHVAFGVNRALSEDGVAKSWFPWVDGIAYWNEDMPTYNDGGINDLDPDVLDEAGNLIGYALDVNGNGQWDILDNDDNPGKYYISSSSMPQLAFGDDGILYFIYSSIMETFDDGAQNYRHIVGLASTDHGTTWSAPVDLTGDVLHMFDECVFPSIAANVDEDYIHIVYQSDAAPGLAVRGDEDDYGDNKLVYLKLDKNELGLTTEIEIPEIKTFSVSQNMPNPFNGTSTVKVTLNEKANVTLEVINLVGQKVLEINKEQLTPGTHKIEINASDLETGVYFYNVRVNNSVITKKMVVR
ncbi:MAG: T9SS type A sorting domain-containing protein [Bacteroidota bacterium]|nr:T9SS type A sorting domain-containing protein [Bacteroidota bacterium]